MAKRQRRRGGRQQQEKEQAKYWKPLHVSLDGPKQHGGGNDASASFNDGDNDDGDFTFTGKHESSKNNHYDNAELQKQANRDLPVQPGEDIAFFYGLEVLDSSQYELVSENSTGKGNKNGEKQQRLVFRTTTTEGSRGSAKEDTIENDTSKPKSDKKKRKRPTSIDDNGTDDRKEESIEDGDSEFVIDSDSIPDNTSPKNTDSSKRKEKKNAKKKKKKRKLDGEPSVATVSDAHSSSEKKGEDSNGKEESSTTLHPSPTTEQVMKVQLNWSQASGGAVLHDKLCQSLASMGYYQPTPIQSETLSASIMGRRNLVGAAPTGSGKTLAFLLPIVQHLLDERDEATNEADTKVDISTSTAVSRESSSSSAEAPAVQALIVTPTRELALQIHNECDKLIQKQCVSLVGGIALVKQERLLSQIKPRIIVGTPGRLWAMISSGSHPHLSDLSQIRFLVLDEADRMVQEHSFPQLIQILETVHKANPGPPDDMDEQDEFDDGSDEEHRLEGLPGVRGEAKVTMLTDEILLQLAAQRNEPVPETQEVPDEDFNPNPLDDNGEDANDESDSFQIRPPVHRQTFIYSATLTLPQTKTMPKVNNKRKRGHRLSLDGPIADILSKTHAMGETKVVDLSSKVTNAKGSVQDGDGTKMPTGMGSLANGVKLPPGLKLEQIKCTQRHKDSHLYAYLLTTSQGTSGPCLVFCNSIACVRRVGNTLQKLNLPVRILHAHMQQRARFKAVESLQNPKGRAIVVCTDVASRGLDIPSVATVVHYDVARSVDTFVHRSGRTARGVGDGAVGSSLSLVAPAEDKAHKIIADSVQATFSNVMIDGRIMSSSIAPRVNLASKIVAAEELEQKAQAQKKWFEEKADEAGLELDDIILEDGSSKSPKEQARLKDAQKAKVELTRLLKEPIKAQRFGKFLSSVKPGEFAKFVSQA